MGRRLHSGSTRPAAPAPLRTPACLLRPTTRARSLRSRSPCSGCEVSSPESGVAARGLSCSAVVPGLSVESIATTHIGGGAHGTITTTTTAAHARTRTAARDSSIGTRAQPPTHWAAASVAPLQDQAIRISCTLPGRTWCTAAGILLPFRATARKHTLAKADDAAATYSAARLPDAKMAR
ncbi:unnamed protein product, partial [Ixodes pacificus]